MQAAWRKARGVYGVTTSHSIRIPTHTPVIMESTRLGDGSGSPVILHPICLFRTRPLFTLSHMPMSDDKRLVHQREGCAADQALFVSVRLSCTMLGSAIHGGIGLSIIID
jgi:hypothetical protein